MDDNKDLLYQKMESIFLRRASIRKSKFSLELNLEEILSNSVYKLGHIMFDLHEEYDIKPEYQPLTEFEIFQTPKDIYEYIQNRTTKKGA